MTAQRWIQEGVEAAKDFNLYEGTLTLANSGGLLYVELTGEDQRMSFPVESKEYLRIAHWIIKEFA